MKLKRLRLESKLTQKKFADKISSRQMQVSLWENGYVIPSSTIIKRMNTVFGWNLNKFDFGEEGTPWY